MNEQLQLALSALIQTSLNAIDKGTTFLSSQIPEVIQQLLLWKALESFLLFLTFGIIILLASFSWLYYQYKYWTTKVPISDWKSVEEEIKMTTRFEKNKDCPWLFNIFVFIPITVGLCASLNNLEWLQIWLAPKLYLIEYAKTFIK